MAGPLEAWRNQPAVAGKKQIEQLLEDIIVDAYGEDEQLWAFRQVFEDELECPAQARFVGDEVTILEFEYAGNERVGLTARVRKPNRSIHSVAAYEIEFPAGSREALHIDAYRRWLGLEPLKGGLPKERHLDLSQPIDLVVLAVRNTNARCRLLGGDLQYTFRSGDVWKLAPGDIANVEGRKQWTHRGHLYLSGKVLGSRLDVTSLGLVPLRLEKEELWEPSGGGARLSFEMEEVVPGRAGNADPVADAYEHLQEGAREGARDILMDEVLLDLRCLGAHAGLGFCTFGWANPETAMRHFQVGVRIGELSLGSGGSEVLPWSRIGNRPFLRCIHGYGLCLWRMGRFEEAQGTFERLLWLDPGDFLGARDHLQKVRSREDWSD